MSRRDDLPETIAALACIVGLALVFCGALWAIGAMTT